MSDKKKKVEEIPVNEIETEVKEVEEIPVDEIETEVKEDKPKKKGPACLS